MSDIDLVEMMNFYYENPTLFVIDVLKAQPNNQQRKALSKLPKNKRITIRSGNGIGKTTLNCWIILWFMTVFPKCKVIITGPKYDQLLDTIWAEMNKWLSQSAPDFRAQWEYTATGLYNKKYPADWFATVTSSNEPTNFQGFHQENILFIVDEASGVDDAIWEAVTGGLTTLNAYVILTGNPNYLSGFFYKSHHDNAHLWETLHFSALDSDNVTKESIELKTAEFGGIESSAYRVRVLGEFPLEDASNLYLPMSLIKYSIFPKEEIWQEEYNPDYEYDLGLDPAREGDDEAVFINSKFNVRNTPFKTIDICWAESFARSDGPFLMGECSNLNNKWQYKNIFPDETGMGGFLYDFMKKDAGMPITPITFGKKAFINGPIHDNNKEAMYKQLKILFEQQKQQCLLKIQGKIELDRPDIFRIPNIPKLITQLAELQYEYNLGSDKLSIHHPQGGHDDWADALALSLFRLVRKAKIKAPFTVG